MIAVCGLALIYGLSLVYAKLPCDYLQMQNGNVVVQPGTTMCLGPCPADISAKGIYVGTGQELRFQNFVLATTDTTLTLSTNKGMLLLSCTATQCFSSTVPENANSLPSGLYLTGRPGGAVLSAFDPWQPISTIQLDSESTLAYVTLQGQAAINGWRLVSNNYSFTFTNKQQMVVGDVSVATILSSPASVVIAEGPVTVRKGVHACPDLQVMHSTLAQSVLLIYNTQPLNGSALSAAAAYTILVVANKCVANPVGGGFLIVNLNMVVTLFFDSACVMQKASFPINTDLLATGSSFYSGIFLT